MRDISKIMRTGEDMAVTDKRSCVREVLETIDKKKLGVVCVVEDQKLIGIITDGDLRRLILKTQDTLPILFMKNVETIMNKNPKSITAGMSIDDCLRFLAKHRFWVAPVVDEENNLDGIVHMQDLLKVKLG